MNLENFSQKLQFFLPLGQKKINQVGSKYPGQGWVGPLLTAGQEYAWVGLGQGPSLVIPYELF